MEMAPTLGHSADIAEPIALKLAALSHPARIEILRRLSAGGCCCCKDIVGSLDLAQSTVSQHLKVLVSAGLVRYAAQGQRSLYEVDREALTVLSRTFSGFLDSCSASPDCKSRAGSGTQE